MYVSGHPLRGLSKYISRKSHLIGKLTKKHVSKKISVIGAITELKKILTKSGSYMATFVIEDPSGKVRAVIFPKVYNQYGTELQEDLVIGLSGKLDDSRGQYQIVCDATKILSIETMIENAKENDTYTPDDKSDIAVRYLDDILKTDEEETPAEESSFLIEIPSASHQSQCSQ
jgi:DNA polymerase-3 subunit alpha